MAWLNATPKPDARTKRAQIGAPVSQISRADSMKKDGIPIQMPPNPAPHITDRLVEIGLTEAAGMGAAPLSWASIHAWQVMTGAPLDPWEARLIRKLSIEYLAEGRRAENENCPPPWRAEVTQREKETELSQLRSVLG